MGKRDDDGYLSLTSSDEVTFAIIAECLYDEWHMTWDLFYAIIKEEDIME